MTIDKLIILLQVKQGLKPIPDGNHNRNILLGSLNNLNLIYLHRNHWVLTSKGQNFIDAILIIRELL